MGEGLVLRRVRGESGRSAPTSASVARPASLRWLLLLGFGLSSEEILKSYRVALV